MKPWIWRLRDRFVNGLIWVLCILFGAALMLWDALHSHTPKDPPEIGND